MIIDVKHENGWFMYMIFFKVLYLRILVYNIQKLTNGSYSWQQLS